MAILGFKKKGNSIIKFPLFPFLILLFVFIIGSIGYYLLWRDHPDSSWVDAVYMTVITITSIGYGETHPLSPVGRLFTMFIAVAGIGSLFYLLGVTMENLFILQLGDYRGKKKMQNKIDKLYDHIIVIGLGRVGRRAVEELRAKNEDYVVVDIDIEKDRNNFDMKSVLYVSGDGANDEALLKAGIERARGVVITTANSATTAFVTLSAKALNPGLFIVARSDSDRDSEKLIRAGASRVVNPYSIGGQRLANLMVNPSIVDLFETSLKAGNDGIGIENIMLPPISKWIGKSLSDMNLRRLSGATIIAVVRNGEAITNTDDLGGFAASDILLVLGSKSQLKQAYEVILELDEDF
jgi:voltage-gated potassium channel